MQIVVTGMGVVSPLATGVKMFWRGLCQGKNGIGRITRFDPTGFRFTQAGEVGTFQLPDDLKTGDQPVDLGTQFMLVAAAEAVREARLDDTSADRNGIGVAVSTNFGGILSGEAVLRQVGGTGEATADDFREYLFQTCADRVAGKWGFAVPRATLSLACASGTAALAYGCDLIRNGRATAVLTGGYDVLSEFAWSGLSALRTMSADAVRPFDKRRDGTIFSEGAAALIIEDRERAEARGAPIHAILAGSGTNNNGYHLTAPAKEGEGSATVMRMALDDAQLQPGDIDHINAHGTGTVPNDVTETQAIKNVFGKHAPRIPVTSIKSMIGHMMGAAGSAEAIASVLALRDGVIPPTINYAEPDPLCDLDTVTCAARKAPLHSVLSNSAGIGGCNAAVIFRRAEW